LGSQYRKEEDVIQPDGSSAKESLPIDKKGTVRANVPMFRGYFRVSLFHFFALR
jgi:hypothetical protein